MVVNHDKLNLLLARANHCSYHPSSFQENAICYISELCPSHSPDRWHLSQLMLSCFPTTPTKRTLHLSPNEGLFLFSSTSDQHRDKLPSCRHPNRSGGCPPGKERNTPLCKQTDPEADETKCSIILMTISSRFAQFRLWPRAGTEYLGFQFSPYRNDTYK